jgi:threonine dehydrogenase-like Zn-dependent dehydrogenase
VRLIEPASKRRLAATALGVDQAVAPGEDDPRADADVIIEATGHPTVLDRAIEHAAPEAIIVIASFYGERKSPVALGSAFHRKRLQLKASQVSRLPPEMTARWTPARRFELVVELLGDATLDALVDPIVPFDDAPAAYARLASDPSESVQAVFRYQEG